MLLGMRETVAANPGIQIIIEYGPGWLRNAGVTATDFFGLIDALKLAMFDLDEDGTEQRVSPDWLAQNIDGVHRSQTNLILRRQ